jgi:hypothetical protein
MPASKQSYIKGLDQDTSKTKFQQTSYYDAHNIRVVTDDGLSTGSIENERGNRQTFNIPGTQPIFKFRRIDNDAVAADETIDVNGNDLSYTALDNILDTDDLFNHFNSDSNIQALITANTLRLEQDDDFVYLIGLDNTLTMTVAGTDLVLTELVPAQTELKIIGWGTLRDYIVVFTTAENGFEPTSSYGQIWKLQYNEYTDSVIGLSGTDLVPSEHLVYNGEVNFSTCHRIEEPVTRYENNATGRVYWTDNYNPLRVINIFNDNNFIIPPGNLDIVADVNLSKPNILDVGAGSIPAGSVVQYAYRLLNQNAGNQTIFSPASQLITLTEKDPSTTIHHGPTTEATAFEGATSVGNDSASVTYTVTGIDQDYDVIEHYYILWETKDNPLIFKFDEQFIPDSGEVTVTHDGTETDIGITLLEYNALNIPFVAKTLASKDDRLVAANIKEPRFDADFDARAYRFSAAPSPDFTIYTSAGVGSTFSSDFSSDFTNIPEDHDAINPYNQEDPDINSDWLTADQYKYQSDGTTLGGEGPLISYTFTEFEYAGNFNFGAGGDTAQRPHTFIDRYLNVDGPFTIGETDIEGNETEIALQEQFKNMASPILNGVYRGYARGEVYRFGIVFYDKKGNPGYVKWIGDIKFPEIIDGYPLGAHSGNPGTSTLKTLGIEFDVTIPASLQAKISGYSVVRVERTESQKTRLGTGLISHMDWETNDQDSLYVQWDDYIWVRRSRRVRNISFTSW